MMIMRYYYRETNVFGFQGDGQQIEVKVNIKMNTCLYLGFMPTL